MNGEHAPALAWTIQALAYALVILAQYRMISRVARGHMKAVVLSWIGWSMLMGISVVAQLQSQAWAWSWNVLSVLLSATGCLLIGVAGLWTGHYSRGKGDVLCLVAGAACMGAFFVFHNPWITTVLAILADLVVAIPMIERAYKDPEGHRTAAWLITFSAWTLTSISILFHFSWLHMLWPLYLIGFSGMMSYLSFFRPRRIMRATP